jgi:hypothetical protein
MPLNAGLPAVPVSGWDVRAGRWITTTTDKQINKSIPRRPCWITNFLSTGVPHTPRPRRRNVSPTRLPKEGCRLQQNQSMDLMLRKGSVLFPSAGRGPQRGAIWTTPRFPDDGSSTVHILKQILYFLFSSISFVFPLSRQGARNGLGAYLRRWGQVGGRIQEFPGAGSVASSFPFTVVRHYPWVNNPLRAWAQCRRPQELITFF